MLYPSCLQRGAGGTVPGADLTFPTRKPAGTFPAAHSWRTVTRGLTMQSWVAGRGPHPELLRLLTQGKCYFSEVAGPLAGRRTH